MQADLQWQYKTNGGEMYGGKVLVGSCSADATLGLRWY